MAQPFSFPPPPPPPPKRDDHISSEVRGGFRGRGGNRGRGGHLPSPSPNGRGSYRQQQNRGGRGSHVQIGTSANRGVPPKRDFSTAFAAPAQNRPRAPPAIPCYDIDVKSILAAKSAPVATPAIAAKRPRNLLGLTPTAYEESESEEEDVDDEASLSTRYPADGVQFEHNGQKLSLNNPAEIAAWIAERRRKFPTKAKVEAAKRVAEEKQRVWEEQKRARHEAWQLKQEARDHKRNEQEKQRLKDKLLAAQVAKAKSAVADTKDNTAVKAKQKAERLRQRAEKAAEQLRKAEEQLKQAESRTYAHEGTTSPVASDQDDSESALESMDEGSSDKTSSSGFSESEDEQDSAPEESTSKDTALMHTLPVGQSPHSKNKKELSTCKNMLKFGRCKFGKKCRYSHDIQQEKPKKPSTTSTKRKGLYHIMVEKEQEEELRRTMRAIVALGEKGVLTEDR